MKHATPPVGLTPAIPRDRQDGMVLAQAQPDAAPPRPGSQKALRECLFILGAALVISILAIVYNAHESLDESPGRRWGDSHQLEQVLTVLGVMGLAFGLFAMRRWYDLKREIGERQQMENTLRQRKERLKEAQRLGRIGDWEVDFVTGKIWWSEQTYKLFELDPNTEPPPFMRFLTFFIPEDATRLQELGERARQFGEGYETDLQARLPSGRQLDLLCIGIPMRDSSGVVVMLRGVIQDITDRKRAQAALTESERKYRALVEQAMDGIITTDEEWRIRFANPAACELLGYTAPELLQLTMYDTYDPEELGQAQRRRQEVLAGKTLRFERDILRKGGTRFPAEVSLRRIEAGVIQVLFRDITRRKKALAALAESEHKYRALVEQASDGILMTNDRWQIEFANPAACDMLGYTEAELLRLNIDDTYRPAERDRVIERRQELPLGRIFRFEREFHRKDGAVISAEISIRRIAGNRFQGIFRDVTARKQAEQTLRDTNQRLEEAMDELQRAQQHVIQQERLSALGTMAGGIAHDFNNSLTAILGFCELLLRQPGYLTNPDKAREYLEIINTAAHDASTVVNRMREFYRHRDKNEIFDVVDLSRLVREAVALTEPKWKSQTEARGVSITMRQLLHDIPGVAANAADLREALTNLIFNAVDALPAGGSITIRTRAEAGRVLLQVSDTGIGMADEVRRRCFEPFFSTKGAGGSGLGLSMVYGIVQRHQGTIDVDSQTGHGTTISISLPEVVRKKRLPAGPLAVDPIAPLNVLVVDDETFALDVITEFLAVDGHHVESAENGLDGLERFHNGRFDVVLLDRAMPGMSGDQVASAIKSTNPRMPVVMITGFGAMMDAADERPSGVDLIVNKPISMADLRTALSRASTLQLA